MKKEKTFQLRNIIPLLFCFSSLHFTSCEQSTDNKNSDTLTSEIFADTGKVPPGTWTPFIDTIYQLKINGTEYELMLSHEILNMEHNDDLTTTVRIIEQGDTLYANTFDFNTTGQLQEPVPGHYWLSLYNSGGGSGYAGTLFNIRIQPLIALQPILEFNEMSFWKSNKSATELIYFYGIWSNSGDDENFESHFSEHLQSVTIYKITEDSVLTLTPGDGLSKNKYDFHDYENREKTLKQFREKESALTKEINWEDYN